MLDWLDAYFVLLVCKTYLFIFLAVQIGCSMVLVVHMQCLLEEMQAEPWLCYHSNLKILMETLKALVMLNFKFC